MTYLPSVREFDRAIRVGMGWGLLPESDVAAELERGELVELVPGRRPEVALYWQHWRLGSSLVAELTDAVVVRRPRAGWRPDEDLRFVLTGSCGSPRLRARSSTRARPDRTRSGTPSDTSHQAPRGAAALAAGCCSWSCPAAVAREPPPSRRPRDAALLGEKLTGMVAQVDKMGIVEWHGQLLTKSPDKGGKRILDLDGRFSPSTGYSEVSMDTTLDGNAQQIDYLVVNDRTYFNSEAWGPGSDDCWADITDDDGLQLGACPTRARPRAGRSPRVGALAADGEDVDRVPRLQGRAGGPAARACSRSCRRCPTTPRPGRSSRRTGT